MADQEEKRSIFDAGGTDEQKRDRFAAGGTIQIAANLASGVFQIAWMTVTQRMLGPKHFGIFGPVQSVYWMLATLIAFGIPQTITTYVSYHYEKNIEESKKFMADGSRLLLLIGAGVLVLGSAVALGLWKAGQIPALSAGIVIAVLFSVMMTLQYWSFSSALNGMHRLDYTGIGLIVYSAVMCASTFLAIVVTQALLGRNTEWAIVGALAGFGVGQGAALVLVAFLFGRMRVMPVIDMFRVKKTYGLTRQIVLFGGMSAVALVCNSLMQFIPPPVVGFVAKHYQSFGATPSANLIQSGYFSSSFIYAMAPMLIMGLASALVPAISEAQALGRHDLMQDYYNQAFKYSFALIFPMVAIYGVIIGPVIQIMSGAAYPAGLMGPMATLFAVGGSMMGLQFLLVNLFVSIKKPSLPALMMVGAVTLEVFGVGLLGAVSHSVMIAGAGFVLAAGVADVVLIIAAKKLVGLEFPIKIMVICIAAAVPAWAASFYLIPRSTSMIGVSVVAIIVVFTLLYVVLGGWDGEDVRKAREMSKSLPGPLKAVPEGLARLAEMSPFHRK